MRNFRKETPKKSIKYNNLFCGRGLDSFSSKRAKQQSVIVVFNSCGFNNTFSSRITFKNNNKFDLVMAAEAQLLTFHLL